ncbi:MAG: transcription-repair coupling factor, partial [Clostridia bacterium]|nr:transcription-repair coupling factor [Clostridia bacterium]
AISSDMTDLPPAGSVVICEGSLERGFEYPTIRTVVVAEGDIFVRRKKKKTRQAVSSKDKIRSFDELSIGDYVVHRVHGIGKYVGLTQHTVGNVIKDFLKIQYKGTDVLYIPTNQLDAIHKYVGATEGVGVNLNSLNGTKWKNTVNKVKQSVEEMAGQLIKLYAARQSVPGHVFEPDTPWQKDFEDDFAYDETPDQLRCIEEIKADMEQGKCMDRLLCGDVGYGKTEVAMRAAFKCVMGGLQVAYLVPTTLLAQQHYNTFRSRMENYGINVELMCRFRTAKQMANTTERLKQGKVDVVIGTHRILSKDVEFKNLGLLIIDEEQRFGVGHKEKLKELKTNVDVLTLSATPIPRTLNMAMIGIRDLSVIANPPQNRYPVQTFVMEYNADVVKNAIERELVRGGQVYYLYNRVDNIESKAAKLRMLLPDAVIEVAHGQMTERQLESKMLDMMNGDIDVLVCTTIIETGIDIPNVNTMIIDNADMLGLSQLYQLRGRVGRSNTLAYAYLMYQGNKVLDETARKRLSAIREFTEFGSGFKIAMRDLEIRGAGNLLGKEQHGNMNLVGYDMYCTLLGEAVARLKGEKVEEKQEVQIELKIDVHIPDTYIDSEQQRFDMYKRISDIVTEEDYYNMQSELIDRFGDMPKSVENLLDCMYIRSLAEKLNIVSIVRNGNEVMFTIGDAISPEAIVTIMHEYKGKIMFSSGEKSYLNYKYDNNLLYNIKIILQKLINITQEGNQQL